MRSGLFISLILMHILSFAAKRTEILLLMGSRFEITAIAPTEELVKRGIQAGVNEVKRIEEMISFYKENSEVNKINANAGISPVKVDKELYDLIYRSKKVSVLTKGYFDISWASMDDIWHFDSTMKKLPTEEEIKQSVRLVNFENVILDKANQTVFLAQKGMKIGLGAIGKGYAANKARDAMKKVGIENGIVIAGGDLITWGMDEGKLWKIGIADPNNAKNIVSWLEVGETAVVTSGNYEKFVYINGERYCHIIDPKTGYPVKGMKSVTIICPDAELADALATSVFIMGKDKGLSMINAMKGVEALLITDNMELISSEKLKLNYYSKDQHIQKHSIIIQ